MNKITRLRNNNKKPNILALETLWNYQSSLPNLGDRALSRGIYALIEEFSEFQIETAVWKPFPHFKLPDMKNSQTDPEALLFNWSEQLRVFSSQRTALEEWLDRIARSRLVAKSPLLGWLEDYALRQTGQPFWNAIGPRLLRAHTASGFIRQLSQANGVIFNGGGLFAEHLSRFLPGRLLELYLAKQLGLPTAVLNYSIDLRSPETTALATPVFRKVDLHVVREARSRELLISLGVNKDRIRVAPDAAFACPPPKTSQPRKQEQPVIILMIRGDREVDVEAWATVVGYLRERHGAKVRYLQGCKANDPLVQSQLAAVAQLERDSGFIGLEATKDALAVSDLIISDRYHSAIFAIEVGTPVVSLASTTHKTAGLFDGFEYGLKVQPMLSKANLSDFLKTIDQAFTNQRELSMQLEARAVSIRAEVRDDYRNALKDFESLLLR